MSTRTFKPGDIVQLVRTKRRHETFAINYGEKAVVQDPAYRRSLGITWLYVTWFDPDCIQSNGGYYPANFELVVEDTFEKDGIE